MTVDLASMVGSVVDGRYRILRELGAGAMGMVYEAEHQGTGRHVALKVILRERLGARKDVVERFQREARAAGAIDTRHIVGIIDSGVDPATDRPYMVMDLLTGSDVSALLKRAGPLPVDVAMKITAQACIGLAKAHDAGVVHRDIKPANLFLDEQDEGEVVVKICDFGIAKVKMEEAAGEGSGDLTRTGTLVGSPLYMAPEQARGRKDIDGRADIWSLGVVLYQLLCGRTPFHSVEALGDLIIAICSEPARRITELAPWVPPETARIVHTALELDKARRHASARDMLAALRELLPQGEKLRLGELRGVNETERAAASKAETTTAKIEPVAAQGDSLGAAMARTDAKVAGAPEAQAPKRRGLALGWGVAAGIALAVGGYFAFGVRHAAPAPPTPSASAAPSSAPAYTSEHPAVITGNIFSGFFALRSPAFLEACAAAGLPLAYRVERNPRARAAAFNDGSAQLIATSLDRFLAEHMKGRIVALLDATRGAHALLLDAMEYPGVSDMTSLAKLVDDDKKSGKKVGLAYPKDSVGQYLLTLLGNRFASFRIADFELVPVETSTDAYNALVAKDNGVVLAITWEPHVTQARKAGYPVVLSSADVDGAIVDVLVASDALLAAHPRSPPTARCRSTPRARWATGCASSARSARASG